MIDKAWNSSLHSPNHQIIQIIINSFNSHQILVCFAVEKSSRARRYDVISHLPAEVTYLILRHMTLVDLCNLDLVCRGWRQVVRNSWIWKDFCKSFLHEDYQKNQGLEPGKYRELFVTLVKRIKNPRTGMSMKKIDHGRARVRKIDIRDGLLAVATFNPGKVYF